MGLENCYLASQLARFKPVFVPFGPIYQFETKPFCQVAMAHEWASRTSNLQVCLEDLCLSKYLHDWFGKLLLPYLKCCIGNYTFGPSFHYLGVQRKFPLTSRKSFGKFSEQEFCRKILDVLKRGLTVTEYISKERFGVFAGCLFLLSFATETEWKEEYFGPGGRGARGEGRVGSRHYLPLNYL